MRDVKNDSAPVLELSEITKSFGVNKVLKGVTMNLYPGRVTAFLGANGAGKSTLIKVLSGVYSFDEGQVRIDSDEVSISSPSEAQDLGIQTVHQRIDETTIPGLSVAENLCFEEIVRGDIAPVKSLQAILPRAREIASALDLNWSDTKLRQDIFELSIADAQLVLLARALVRSPKVLVLDEPTSTLSPTEVERLFDVIDSLKTRGVAILYVSHHLSEISRLADDLVVLRDGRIIDEQTQPFKLNQAIQAMLGKQVLMEANAIAERRGDSVALALQGVQLLKRSSPIDISFRYGEVTGIIGLIGAGKSELARGIFGCDPFKMGTMTLDGADYAPKSTNEAVRKRVFFVPEDRAAEAMLPGWSIERTCSLPFIKEVSPGGIVSRLKERIRGRKIIDDFGVIAQAPDQQLDALSGGNQQKVVVGRWLVAEPKVMLLDEPFRGVDIGARRDLSQKIRELAEQGVCVVVFASDVDEIMEISDRIVVLVEGEVTSNSYISETTQDDVVRSMTEVA